MKGDAAHEVPLSPAAVAILQGLPRWTGPCVFSITDGERPISGFSKMKEKIDAAMRGVAPWRFHDLRRTMRLHKVYDQHGYREEKRRAFDLWAARLLSIVEPVTPSNVIQIAART